MRHAGANGPVLPGKWMIGGAAASVAAVTVLMHVAGLHIDPAAPSLWPFYACGGVATGLCVGFRKRTQPHHRFVRDLAEYLALATLIALVGALASYPDAAVSHGFIDPTLARADAALGFDWVAWYRVVAAHRWLQLSGRVAYDAIYWTPAAILAFFAWTGRQDRARALLASLAIAAAITLTLFAFLPAVGPFAYLWRGPAPYMPVSGLWQPLLIPPLREHHLHVVDVGALRGLVSIPSYHTAAGVLFIAAAWPERRLRWPVLAVNAAMLLATPVEGTHYLVDMIAGAGVAGVALALVRGLHAGLRERRGVATEQGRYATL